MLYRKLSFIKREALGNYEKRYLFTMLLVLLMLTLMPISALAAQRQGSGVLASEEYMYVADYDSEDAVGEVVYESDKVDVSASVTAYCCCHTHSEMLTNSAYHSDTIYASARVTNKVPTDESPYYHECSISYIHFTGKVGTGVVADITF